MDKTCGYTGEKFTGIIFIKAPSKYIVKKYGFEKAWDIMFHKTVQDNKIGKNRST